MTDYLAPALAELFRQHHQNMEEIARETRYSGSVLRSQVYKWRQGAAVMSSTLCEMGEVLGVRWEAVPFDSRIVILRPDEKAIVTREVR